MGLKNRIAKFFIDPAFRNPALLRVIFALDDATGIDLVRTLAPIKLMPASAELFQRCFAHFTMGEEISLFCATELAKMTPDHASAKYLLIQADEERTHLEHFRHKLDQFGLPDEKLSRFVAADFKRFNTLISERLRAGDYVNALVGNNIVVEGLAICLLTIGCGDLRENSDEITKFLDFVLEDERHHVRFGERRLGVWNERGLVRERDVETFFGEMWDSVEGALRDIPDVLGAMGLSPEPLLNDLRAYYRERFAGAGLAIG